MCIRKAAAPVWNKGIFYSLNLLDQIQALVSMNSMLVLPEQATDVVGPSRTPSTLFRLSSRNRVSGETLTDFYFLPPV